MDWSACADVERIEGMVSGQLLVQGVLDNAEYYTPEEMAAEGGDGGPG